MKIMLITTGGTIASVIDDDVIDVKPQGKLLVLEKYRDIDLKTQFDVLSPVNILSENICADDYKAIASAVNNVDFSAYDGVIVTHGSDTLAYTAALLGLLFSDKNIPIAVVAADKSLQDEKSNGMINFICAVEIIKNKMNGVFVPYRNADGVTYVHHGTHLFESSILSDDFYSVGGACAVYKDGVITKCANESVAVDTISFEKADLSFKKKILQVMPYPQLDYNRIDLTYVDAVLHRTYHAGSVCVSKNKNESVVSFIERCKKQNIDFYICGLKKGKANYQTLDSILSRDVKVLYDLSPACAYMKIMLKG